MSLFRAGGLYCYEVYMHLVNAAVLEQWGSLTDDQVVSQILAGQTALFEVLMRRHNERLYRAARAILRDEAEAEDVIQQAYVNAYAHLRQFDGRSAFATWLTRIAVNEAIGRARRRGQYQPVGDGEITRFPTVFPMRTTPDPEKQAFTHEIRVVLEAAVDALPDGYRVVFMLREIEGLSTAETAECLGVNESVVKTRLLRARAALRRDLTERVGEAAATSFAFLRPRCDRVVAAVLAHIGA
jgi:RNA polymerase sigma-70 factor (ECF subfamily)